MRNRRISDADADALLTGDVPPGRDDLAELADVISEIRGAAFTAAGRQAPPLVREHVTPGARDALGIAARIALGVGAVLAVSLATTAGAGAAGLLPGPAQQTFDTIVSTVIPGLEYGESGLEATPSPEPKSTEHPDTFGGEVSKRAQEPNKDGRAFGEETSEEAQENGNGTPPVDPGNGNNGNGTPPENPGNGTPPENPGNGNGTPPIDPGPPAENPGNGNGPPEDPGKPSETGPSGGTGQSNGPQNPGTTGKPDGVPGGNPQG